MKIRHILFILTIFLFAGASCKKINPINTDSNLKLEFSADTVLFDTVFTSLGSATHELRIYNRNSDDLQISSIRLGQGDDSPFRLNLDGESATEIYDKIIPAKDSLFSFLRVTINPNDLNTPFVVEDELEFVTNGNTQTVKLLAWGQNANYIVGDKVTNVIQGKYTIVADSLQTTIWTKERPYVIYGWALINSYGTLRIEAGTKVYCHQGSGIFSWSDGQLNINYTADKLKMDWDVNQQRGAEYAFNEVTPYLHDGAIILLHAVSSDNANALESIINYAKEQGYTFKSLDELRR